MNAVGRVEAAGHRVVAGPGMVHCWVDHQMVVVVVVAGS